MEITWQPHASAFQKIWGLNKVYDFHIQPRSQLGTDLDLLRSTRCVKTASMAFHPRGNVWRQIKEKKRIEKECFLSSTLLMYGFCVHTPAMFLSFISREWINQESNETTLLIRVFQSTLKQILGFLFCTNTPMLI